MWENKSLDVDDDRTWIESSLLKNTIIEAGIKKIQYDFISANEINSEKVFASFELSKKYFLNNNKFEENENGNVILNPLKSEFLIYEPYSKYEKINQQTEIEVVQIKNEGYIDRADETSDIKDKFFKDNFKAVSVPVVRQGSIYTGISMITGEVII